MGSRRFQAGSLSKTLGVLIKESLVIPQAELARRIGVSHDTVSRWLNGLRPIDIEELALICEACELDMIKLVAKAQALNSDAVDPPKQYT
jgi:transcriptional regulator with XRE-family HTH domain